MGARLLHLSFDIGTSDWRPKNEGCLISWQGGDGY
jgi:hypothetical protein